MTRPALDDFCSACDQPMGADRHMEHLATPIGRCFVRTCNTTVCIDRARVLRDGHPVDPGPTDEERKQAKLRPAAQQGELTEAAGDPDPNGFWASIGGPEWAQGKDRS